MNEAFVRNGSTKGDKPITTLIFNHNILGPTQREAHIFPKVDNCFTDQTQVHL